MADGNVSLDFLDNYARIRKQLWSAKPMKKSVIAPPPVVEEQKSKIPSKFEIYGIHDHPLLRGIKRKNVARIVQPILERENVPWSMILNTCRSKTWHWVRYECYYALFVNGYGYSEIARLCSRDHTSVMYGIRKWRREKGDDYQRYIIGAREDARVLPEPSGSDAATEECDARNSTVEGVGVFSGTITRCDM